MRTAMIVRQETKKKRVPLKTGDRVSVELMDITLDMTIHTNKRGLMMATNKENVLVMSSTTRLNGAEKGFCRVCYVERDGTLIQSDGDYMSYETEKPESVLSPVVAGDRFATPNLECVVEYVSENGSLVLNSRRKTSSGELGNTQTSFIVSGDHAFALACTPKIIWEKK